MCLDETIKCELKKLTSTQTRATWVVYGVRTERCNNNAHITILCASATTASLYNNIKKLY